MDYFELFGDIIDILGGLREALLMAIILVKIFWFLFGGLLRFVLVAGCFALIGYLLFGGTGALIGLLLAVIRAVRSKKQ